VPEDSPVSLHIPQLIPQDALSAALAYATSGWYVIPVARAKKNPGSILGEHWHTQSSRDPKVIASWFAGSDYGIALHVGRSGAVVLDIDSPDDLDRGLKAALAASRFPFQSTRDNDMRKGHAVYLMPPGRTLGNGRGSLTGAWGEIRGSNGVIIVEPSIHEKKDIGGKYVWKSFGAVPPLPQFIADALPDAIVGEAPATRGEVRSFRDRFTERVVGLTSESGYRSKFVRDVTAGASRHDTAVATAVWAAKEARAGVVPASLAFDVLRKEFLAVAQDETNRDNKHTRTKREAEREWADIEAWSVGQALSLTIEAVQAVRDIALRDTVTIPTQRQSPEPKSALQPFPASLPASLVPVQNEIDEEAFWTSRPELTIIRQSAWSRQVSPWAVLGAVLVRIVAATSHEITLPPLIGGGAGSLNLFVALVGPSGMGKGASESLAKELLPNVTVTTRTPGSGEGLTHAYLKREKGNIERLQWAVLFSVSEIDQLVSVGLRRMGATLLPQLRSAWSGESLGFQYATPEKNLPLEAHTYRLCMLVGVQPRRAEPLLADADGGTPQRFVWLMTTDDKAPPPDRLPPFPGPLTWSAAHGYRPGSILIPDRVVKLVKEDRYRRLSGDPDAIALDAHGLLAQLKVAAALGALDGRHGVSEEDWDLADIIMRISRRTREYVQSELASAAQEANSKMANAEKHRRLIIEDGVDRDAAGKVRLNVLEKLTSRSLTESGIKRLITPRHREYVEEVVAQLVEDREVIEIKNDEEKSSTYRLAT